MTKKKQTKKRFESIRSFFKTYYFALFLVLACIVVLAYFIVLDPVNLIKPRISQECCENFCDKGNLDCHRYNSEYIICKTRNQDQDGFAVVFDFIITNKTKVCYDDMSIT